MRNTKTIGGGSPFEDPAELYARDLGRHIVDMSSTKLEKRWEGYTSLMALRRYFTIAQWTAFNKSMDTFRKERSFTSLTEMMQSISTEMIQYRMGDKHKIIKKEEPMAKITETTSSGNGTEIRQLIEGLAQVTAQLAELTNRVASIVPVLPVGGMDFARPEPVRKGENTSNEAETKGSAEKSKEKTGKGKKSAGSSDGEKPADYKKLCRECIAEIARQFGNISVALPVFKKHEVNGLNSAPVEKLPAIYEDLKAAIENGTEEEGNE